MHTFMVVADYISVFIMFFCIVIIANQNESRMQKYSLLLCCSLFLACLGYLIREDASEVSTLITGQKLMYIGVPHGMFLMILFICEYCGFNMHKAIRWSFHSLNTLLTLFIVTMDHHKLFYKSYWKVELEDGSWMLEKEYGFLHDFTVGLFALYMIGVLVVAIIFTIKRKGRKNRSMWKLMVGVLLPNTSYAVSKIIGGETDFMPIALSIFAIIVIYTVYVDKLYDVKNISYNLVSESMTQGVVVFDNGYKYKGCNDMAADLFPLLQTMELDSDVRNTCPQLAAYLDGNSDDYKFADKYFGVSLRDINDGTRKIGRVLWFDDKTTDRYFTASLNQQKQMLQSEVETLAEASYKDALTGIGNRLAYKEFIQKIKENGNISNVTVMSFDLNGLKVANDTYGHSAGDELIKGAADVISGTFAGRGKCFRTGGDEFAVIITQRDTDVSFLVEKFMSHMHAWRGKEVDKLSISFGIAVGAENPDISLDELIAIADKTMYQWKRDYHARQGDKK